MKTLELKLKKDVLIVEIPRLADYEFINKECKYLKVGNEEIKLNISSLDKFEFLCKGSELTEEIASELVEMEYDNFANEWFKDYKIITDDNEDDYLFLNAKPSFISAVESKGFYWLENPIEIIERGEDTEHNRVLNQNEWQEAEEKTFRNPLIFIKNYVQ